MSVNYLDIELMEKMCHRLAVAVFDTGSDPIPPFREHEEKLLDMALNSSRHTFDGKELYPTLVDKAAILYYTVNKDHPFKNGNKRIATATLLVFLYINGRWLDTGKSEMVKKALGVAVSKSSDKDKVIADVKEWIEAHLVLAEDNLKD